ncbi:MAG TPA: hypothetical protein VFC00_09180 [Micromonosporaceae bacterium]|nr:hypothetical protein [Micromonosporaceae bacterium]
MRRPALVVAAALLGAGPLLASPAAAAPLDAGLVEFTGGPGGLLVGCTSQPSESETPVYANAPVFFRNSLGTRATLKISGQPSETVESGSGVTKTFAESVVVTMEPQCEALALNRSFDAAAIKVLARPVQNQPTQAAPPATGPQVGPGPATPPSAVAAEPVPGDDVASGVVLPSLDAGGPESAVDDVGDPAAVPPGNTAALDPALAAAPARDGGNGLLALVAAVCVAGVSAAAIRAILSQRASRAAAA